MRWGARTVIAGTAGVALAGAGALTAAYAADSPPPATTAAPVATSDASRVAALTQEAQNLRDQVAELEAEVAGGSVATPAPTLTDPAQSPSASLTATFETPRETVAPGSFHGSEPGEHESDGHESGGHDDGGFDD